MVAYYGDILAGAGEKWLSQCLGVLAGCALIPRSKSL